MTATDKFTFGLQSAVCCPTRCSYWRGRSRRSVSFLAVAVGGPRFADDAETFGFFAEECIYGKTHADDVRYNFWAILLPIR